MRSNVCKYLLRGSAKAKRKRGRPRIDEICPGNIENRTLYLSTTYESSTYRRVVYAVPFVHRNEHTGERMSEVSERGRPNTFHRVHAVIQNGFRARGLFLRNPNAVNVTSCMVGVHAPVENDTPAVWKSSSTMEFVI